MTLLDVNDNPLAGQVVKFKSSLKNSHASDQVKDEGDGIYTATLTGTTAGETSIEVIVNGAVLQIKNSAKVTLTADNKHPSNDKSKLEADPTTIVADGKASSTIKLTLLDVNDNPLAGQVVKFKSSLKNSHVSDQVKDEGDGDGIYTATLTGSTAGETSIEVTVNDVVLPVKDAAKVTLTADSSNPSLDKSKLTAEPITIVADGKDSTTLKLTLIDIKDNPITGYPDKVVFSTEPADSKIKLEAFTEQEPGVYSAKLTGTQAGDISITAKFNGLELKLAPVTVTLTADSKNPSVDKSKLVAEPTTIVADDKQTSTLKLTLMDANDNPIEGQVVKFEPSLANSQFDEVKENDKGVYTAKLKGKTAGVNTIKVKVNDKEFAIKTDVTLIADSNTAVLKQVTLDGDNTSKVANGNDNFTFTAVVKDANDNPVPEITLKWQHNAGNKVTLSDKGESKTDPEGKAKITLTSTTNTVTEVQVSAKTGDDEAVDANKKVNFLRKFNLNGVVADATTDKPIEGAEVGLYTSDSDSKPKYKVTSGTGGKFSISDVLDQRYTLKTKANKYIDYKLDITNPEQQLQRILLIPELGNDYARIVLSWGPKPSDLDAYLWGDTDKGQRFHVSYNSKTPDGSAMLDIDVKNGFGPETITIKRLNPGRYRFAVHNFSNEEQIIKSNAKVVVAQKDKDGDTKVSEYDIPISGTGWWWEVFEMDGDTGDIRPVNTISDNQPN
ncbi:hypothetical protein CBG25_07100 [Arsenophonus sp. ENCA]|nr:hypothetical protein CBG25_07100 [Arsenophonus sp. ENCA]